MPGSLVGVVLSIPGGAVTAPPRTRVASWIRAETTGGVLLLIAAAAALVWANSPWQDGYLGLRDAVVGPAALHLELSVGTWAADGLLAIFFFVVGVELKHELVAGSLRRPREAAVPVLAAFGGMVVPAAVYAVAVVALGDAGALHGWAIPAATDIAFALAVLAVFGRGLPVALRTFLLTLAVVDDLLAIVVIAVFYSASIHLVPLVAALACVAVFAVLVRLRRLRWWLLVPLAVVAWWCMHESGVHATIAGVLLGAVVPARLVHGETVPRTQRLEHAVRPVSTFVALPVFAFFAAGVAVGRGGGFADVVGQPVFVAVGTALVAGKIIGVLGTTALVTRVSRLRLPDSIGLRDLLPVGFLTGIGFTVALLIADLSFTGEGRTDAARLGVLAGSLLSAILGAVLLRWDARRVRSRDMNEDGIPDAPGPLIGDGGGAATATPPSR